MNNDINYKELYFQSFDELEVLHSAHDDLQKEYSITKKRNEKMQRKQQVLGKRDLEMKNLLRANGIVEWKNYNKGASK